jgi:hypothetical protein
VEAEIKTIDNSVMYKLKDKNLIIIEYNSSTYLCKSYAEIQKIIDSKIPFLKLYTCCLNFFSFDYLTNSTDVIIIKHLDTIDSKYTLEYMLLSDLLSERSIKYTPKQIVRAHNVNRLFISGSFNWQKCKYNKFLTGEYII